MFPQCSFTSFFITSFHPPPPPSSLHPLFRRSNKVFYRLVGIHNTSKTHKLQHILNVLTHTLQTWGREVAKTEGFVWWFSSWFLRAKPSVRCCWTWSCEDSPTSSLWWTERQRVRDTERKKSRDLWTFNDKKWKWKWRKHPVRQKQTFKDEFMFFNSDSEHFINQKRAFRNKTPWSD